MKNYSLGQLFQSSSTILHQPHCRPQDSSVVYVLIRQHWVVRRRDLKQRHRWQLGIKYRTMSLRRPVLRKESKPREAWNKIRYDNSNLSRKKIFN